MPIDQEQHNKIVNMCKNGDRRTRGAIILIESIRLMTEISSVDKSLTAMAAHAANVGTLNKEHVRALMSAVSNANKVLYQYNEVLAIELEAQEEERE